MKFTLSQNAWQGFDPVEIELPDDWDVEYYGIPGDKLPALTKEQLREKINSPYNSETIYELAKKAKEVCIVFDDISRGTPVRPMAEIVLEELKGAGIKDENIRFICALGTHGAHNRLDFVNKLGEYICDHYPIYNHNCYENNVCIGTSSKGYEVCCNKEMMSCDLRIGIGAITPHPFNGFGGGAKLIFPGMASIETIASNHKTAVDDVRERKINAVANMGDITVDGMRREIEEMIGMMGQFFKIDCIYNTKLEIVDLYAGNAIDEYYAAIPAAQELYSMPRFPDKDIIITNANAKSNEAQIAVGLGSLAVNKSGGDIVVINRTKMGQCTHYLFGEFGKEAGGRMHGRLPKIRPWVNRYIFWMHPDLGSRHWYGDIDKQIFVNEWSEVVELLREKHGPGTTVGIIADGTISCFEQPVSAKDYKWK